jgi:putative glutamine amidotransferase
MPRAPLILISTSLQRRGEEFADRSVSLSERYAQAVVAAGGLPWVLPCATDEDLIAEAVRRSDGVMLTGGDDIQAGLHSPNLSARLRKSVGPPQPARDFCELILIREVFRERKPLLAICRGHQLLNVALGGTLFVDIASQVPGAAPHNRQDRKDQPVHKVELTPDSLLSKMLGQRTVGVNSTHHQAVARLARPLRAVAVSPDGIVEGMELAEAAAGALPFLLSVQFHPERLFDRHAVFLRPFRAFTVACRAEYELPL